MYDLAVFVSAPSAFALSVSSKERLESMGARLRGGDMYEQHLNFVDFVASRSLAGVEGWANTLECPIIHVDGTRSISDNTEWIAEQYLRSKSNEKKGDSILRIRCCRRSSRGDLSRDDHEKLMQWAISCFERVLVHYGEELDETIRPAIVVAEGR